jgi:hypothetical protein
VRQYLLAVVGILCVAGCGSGSDSTPGGKAPARGTLEALAQGSGPTVAVTPGSADFAPGPVRYTFLVVAKDGRVITRPEATVWLSRGLKRRPFQQSVARLEPIGVPGTSSMPFGVPSLYVTHLDVPAPGTYWLLAKPKGARISALGNLIVKKQSASPALGTAAPGSNTPTLSTTKGKLGPLTTAPHPDRQLYGSSVADSLRDHVPFVLAFATPKFCTSRTCGPVVDVLSRVRQDLSGSPVRFIHVEVYAGNDPSNGYNEWMKQWGLVSEPWVFLVGADGRIKGKFEGSVSVAELRDAVQRQLMR